MAGVKDLFLQMGMAIALEMAETITSSRESMDSFLKESIKDAIKPFPPDIFKYNFDHDIKMMKDIQEHPLYKLKEYAFRTDDPKIAKIKQNIAGHFPYFDTKWILDFMKNELSDYYTIMLTDAEPEKFQKWFTDQVEMVKAEVEAIFAENL